jgi:hypothetical protein
MWVNHLLYLGVLEQLLCMCLPYGFISLWSVAVLNVLVGAGVCCMAVGHHTQIKEMVNPRYQKKSEATT